jgi:probable HAF family extracellular repeat protein
MDAKLFSISLLAAGVLLASASQANASGYYYTDLSPGAFVYSQATGINNSGQVVGYTSYWGRAAPNATIWSGATPSDIGYPYSQAMGINNSGQVVGGSCFLGDCTKQHATSWNGTTGQVDLSTDETQGRIGSYAYGINDSGQVVGVSNTLGKTLPHATIWNGTTPTDLGTLGGSSLATDINNSGQVVGYSSTLGNTDPHAIIWNGTTLTDLGPGFAFAINDSGQVVGASSVTSGGYHATIWNGTTPTDLGTLVGGSYSVATGINNSGQVVGWSYTLGNTHPHAIIWNGTTPTDLNNFLSVGQVNAGWHLGFADDINDNGWIVGTAFNTLIGINHAFLLNPCDICPVATTVPEPETYAMFMAGLGLMGFMARRRKNGQA